MSITFRVMIRCPETGKVLDSGIRTSGRETASGGLWQEGSMSCPYCRKLHSFERNSYLDVESTDAANGLWRPNL